jgi:hypothetical protein
MIRSVATIASRVGWLGAVASGFIALTGSFAMADEMLVPVAAMPYPQNPTTATTRSWDIGFVDPALNYYLLADRGVKGQTGGFIDVFSTSSLSLVTQLPGFIGNVSKVTAPAVQTFNGCHATTPPTPVANPPASCLSSSLGAVKSVSGPNGTMTIMHRYAVGGDGNSTVKILGLSGSLLASLSTGGLYRADEMCFDPTHGLIMVTNDAEDPWPFTTIINMRGFAQTQVVFSQANLSNASGGTNSVGAVSGAEQCQWNPRTGEFWHAIPQCYAGTQNSGNGVGDGSGNGCVVTISTTGQITNVFAVPCNPNGLAIGPVDEIALGCQTNPWGITVFLADGSGGQPKGAQKDWQGGCAPSANGCSGNDEIDFNPTTGHYVMADGTGAFPPGGTSTQGAVHLIDSGVPAQPESEGGIISVDPDAATCTGSVVCAGGNHSVAADPVNNYVFVPIREATSGTGGICSVFGIPDAAGCIAVFSDPSH